AYDPQRSDPPALIAAIQSSGYDASLPASEQTAIAEQEAQDRADRQEDLELRRKAIVSLVVGIIAMILSMPLMTGGGHESGGSVTDPFMRWVMDAINPTLAAWLPWLYTI